jgi:hypothetical protein
MESARQRSFDGSEESTAAKPKPPKAVRLHTRHLAHAWLLVAPMSAIACGAQDPLGARGVDPGNHTGAAAAVGGTAGDDALVSFDRSGGGPVGGADPRRALTDRRWLVRTTPQACPGRVEPREASRSVVLIQLRPG